MENLTEIKAAVDEMADAFEGKVAKLEDRYDRLETAFKRSGSGGGDLPTAKALKVEAEHKAYGHFVKTGEDTELKALSAGSNPDGGYLVDTQLQRTINQKIFDQSPIRRLARVVNMRDGDAWEEPWDVSDVGAEWVGETQARSETDPASLKLIRIPLNEVYANQVVTQKLMDLSFVDIGQWLEGKIADKFGRTEGIAYVNGNGVGKPRGFMSYAAASTTDDDNSRDWGVVQHVVSGAATTITADALRDCFWRLRAPYRSNGAWLMSSATANVVDKLKDGQGQYLWRSATTAGEPPTLLGRPVEFDENMPAVGAGLFPIAFGDFRRAYTVVDWQGVKSLRDPFTSKPNVIFYAYRRTGGDVTDFDALKLLKIAAA